jgi:putative intracellular protease/amidase
MAGELNDHRVAILAADGVERVELEQPRQAVSDAGAVNELLSANKAGLAVGLLSTSQQLGMALGLAVLSVIATARTDHLLPSHATRAAALTAGYQRALLVCSIFVLLAALIASRIPNSRAAAQPLVVPEAAPEPAAP